MAFSLIDISFNCILNIYSYTTDNFSSFLPPKNLLFFCSRQALSEKFTTRQIQRKNKCPWSTKPQLIHLQRKPIPQAQDPSQRKDGGMIAYKNQMPITRQCLVEMTGKLTHKISTIQWCKQGLHSEQSSGMPKWMIKISQISTTKLRLIGNQRLLREKISLFQP